ncbi:helix-turn-helix domain-containing protein [Tenacibaculum halocynthiae]|uniref:helix-turn-helix domain-containing protein n=1 Tax=Tenacibaculum halocynthiae TaxID=1254437 RepID=UPI003D649195
MDVNEISFDKLPQAVAKLLNEVKSIKSLVVESQRIQLKEEKIPIGIDEACKLIGKAKPTVYTLVRKRIIPSYKNGKKLYFFKEELLEWIENGRRKTLDEIERDSENFIRSNNSSKRK